MLWTRAETHKLAGDRSASPHHPLSIKRASSSNLAFTLMPFSLVKVRHDHSCRVWLYMCPKDCAGFFFKLGKRELITDFSHIQ